jgi:hypothetical protein
MWLEKDVARKRCGSKKMWLEKDVARKRCGSKKMLILVGVDFWAH